MASDVKVVYRKHDGSLHWHMTTQWLGEDEHGIWTGAARPSLMRKGDGPLVTLEYASVMLFPRDAWWTAAFNDAPASTEIYCDVTTPVSWPSPGEVTMVDLDLDVSRRRTGEVQLWDEDEFASHQVKYGYPAEVIDEAERAAEWLRTALTQNSEPFATTYRSYLAMVTEASNGELSA
jgi:protein associated with RNAse G/E